MPDRIPPTPQGLSHDRAFITLPIDQIRYYDADPRQGENPEYARIKASILAKGVDQPLIVTQRPGETGYMVHSGGNTRLRALRELSQETADARFTHVDCVVRPWTEEIDVLLAHLRENDLRGPLTFIDKALAVHAAKGLIEAGRDGERLDQKRLCQALADHGYAVSRTLVCQMTYAVERLLPLLPQALAAGIGRPQVERIRQLERATQSQWRDRLADEADFKAAFAALCHRADGPDWDIADLRRALEAEIAERAEVSIHAVHLDLEQTLSGAFTRDFDELTDMPTDPDPVEATLSPSPEAKAPQTVPSRPVTTGRVDEDDSHTSMAVTREEPTPRPAAVTPNRDTPGEDDQSSAAATVEGRPDLKSLRARAWTLASRLAQRHGLGELIQPLKGRGLGFVLTDVPDPALIDHLDADALARVSMVWWHLVAAAEITVAPIDQLLTALDGTSVLRRALQDQDAGLLFASVWTLDPGHMGFRLWRTLGERDWQDLLDLMANYRALHRAARTADQALWP